MCARGNGFIYTMAGKGCFVADLSDNELINKRNEIIKKKMSKDIEYYKELGLSLSEATGLMKSYFLNE